MKVVRLSALRTGRLYLQGNMPGTHFCYRLSRPHGLSAVGRITSMKNYNDAIGNRTRDLPACSAVHVVRVTDVKRSFVKYFSRQVWQYDLVIGIQSM